MSPLPGHSPPVRGEGEAELGVSSLLLAWLPVPWQLPAMPVILGYLGSTWLVFFPCSGLGLAMSCTSCTSLESLSEGFGTQIGEGSSSPARPSQLRWRRPLCRESAWPASKGDSRAGALGRQSRHGQCHAGCKGAAPHPGGELLVKCWEMLSQICGGGEASPKVPRRARLPPQQGARGLLSSVEEQGGGVEEVLEKTACRCSSGLVCRARVWRCC